MDYFNNNVHFYSSSTAAGNFDPYPVPSSAPATGAGVAQTLDASTVGASYWDTVEQLGPMANPWWDIPIQANHDSVAPATPSLTETDDDAKPQYAHPTEKLPEPRIRTRAFALLGWDGSPTTPAELEALTPTLALITLPLDCWGDDQGGADGRAQSPSRGLFELSQPQNVHIPHQLDTGATRNEPSRAGRFNPYSGARARRTERTNAEAGSSILPPTTKPSGGKTETTADAENDQTFAEEDEAPMPKKARLPRGEGAPRPWRINIQEDILRSKQWAKTRKGLRYTPSLNQALSVVLEAIATIREVVYSKPHLSIKEQAGNRVSGHVAEERDRRRIQRRLLQELSKYYRRDEGPWRFPGLFTRAMEDVKTHPDLQ